MLHPDGLFGWVDTFTSNPDRAKDFYAGLFGWAVYDRPTDVGVDYTQFYLDGQLVAGLSPLPPEMAAEGILPQWVSYVLVSDVDATCAATRAAGGQVMMAPMDAGDQGRLANIMDPSGGFLGVWQPYDHQGADVFNVPGSLTWNELQTRDLAAALPFYEKVFGWEWQPGSEPGYQVAMLAGKPGEDKSNAGAEDMPPNVPEEVPAVWQVYFAVNDVAGTVEDALTLGGRVFVAPRQTANGVFAGILDPNGGRFMVAAPA
ncbi:MAG: VOC family protein [Candidatus Nanopelagicales bacterium]